MRRHITGWAVLGLAALSAAGVLGWQLAWVETGNQAWNDDQAIEAVDRYDQAVPVAVVERWLPLYNRGVAQYSAEHWDASAADFKAAAALAPDAWQCPVHLNWSLALEAGADYYVAHEDLSGAVVRYQEAQVVLGVAPCNTTSDQATAQQEEQWREARERIEQKVSSGSPQSNDADPSDGDVDPDQALSEREQQAQEQRQLAEDSATDQEGGTERTW